MLGNYLIGLREGLEAALVIGILVAYLVRTNRRSHLRYVWLGVSIAAVVSLGLGAALTLGPRNLSFEAQEAIGGFLSIFAVGLITWMIFWMGKTARHLKGHLEANLERALSMGSGAVLTVALLAVGREGLETALFLWAGVTAAGASSGPIIGAMLGIATAIALGYLIYRGAVKVNLRWFFQWTGTFLVVVAGGVLAYGIHDLQEAGILPGLNVLAFDVSSQIPPGSVHGTVLKGIFNFSARTTVFEAIAWVAYVLPTLWFFIRMAFAPMPQRSLQANREQSDREQPSRERAATGS